ncbi:MAG: AAA family ATPase [Actinobacteria bacterium]|nr:AAA family ATPase [Actinomycetota bacterium]
MDQTPSDAPITVLVTDVEGSTDLQSRLGDTKARELMRAHEAAVREALAAHGGHEIKTMGDGFLATFTSTRRAIEGAIAIQSSADELRVRVGVHCGEVLHERGDIHGAAVVAAARIMSQARGGEIVVSDLVRQLAGAAGVTFRERARVPLKGLDGTWLLHDVLWRQAADGPEPPPATTSAAPALIGRDAERAVLDRAMGDALAGKGRLVLLAGEPGIGKTTLATAAVTTAENNGALVLWGSCWEGEGAPAFWPWIQVLRAYAATRSDDELAVDAGTDGPELKRLVPDLAARLPAAPVPHELEPEQARFRLFDAVASFLWRAAARQPVVVVIDDLHWADESSMRLLTFVAGQLATHPVAIVGTYRDTDVGPDHPLAALLHDASRRGQLLPVGGLDGADVARLMAKTAGTELRIELATAVHQQTGGNPLFVAEVTRLLASQNALDRTEVSVGVPQGVREVIERRMVRLPQRCIELLTLGAVIGEEFAVDIVARAAGVPAVAVVEALEPALLAGAARETGMGHYRFSHALFREVLYEGQGTIARAGLHLQVANALAARHLEGAEVAAAELANHFYLAALTGETDQAVKFARLAGHDAASAFAYAEAVGHFERALEVLGLGPHPTEGARAAVLLDLAGARWRAGDRVGAQADVARAIELARRTGESDVFARAAIALHRLGGVSGAEDNERLRLLSEARDVLGTDDTALRVRVLAAFAKEQYHTWLREAQSAGGGELASEAVAIARRLGDDTVLAEALAAQHDTLWFTGKEAERLEIATELQKVATSIGDREQTAEAVLLQSVALLETSHRDALSRLEEFVALADELNNPRFEYFAATRRATLALIRGDIPAAEAALAAAEAIAQRHGEPDHTNVAAAQVFTLRSLQHRRSESVAPARKAYTFNKAYGEMIEATTCLGFADEGDLVRAAGAFAKVDLRLVERRYRNYGWLYQVAVVTEAAAAVGATDALELLGAELEPYGDRCIVVAGAVNFYGSVSHYLGVINHALGRADAAERNFADALAAYDRLGATIWADRTRVAMRSGGRITAVHNEMRREGSSWVARFDGTTVSIRASKGLRDLAVLLAAPCREVAAADLMTSGEVAVSGADAVLDDRARAEFRARLAELDADLATAETDNDLDRISLVRAERDALAHELAAALGLGGRSRTLGDPAERARKAVAARLRDAIDKIGSQHPELGRHLRASVRTGTFCSYTPPSPTSWHVTEDTPR